MRFALSVADESIEPMLPSLIERFNPRVVALWILLINEPLMSMSTNIGRFLLELVLGDFFIDDVSSGGGVPWRDEEAACKA